MPTITSNQSGDWSLGTTWVGGSPPVDGDAVVIAAGHSVKMNVDQSAWTGLVSVTINGSSGTPGMLYWMNGASGHLKIRDAGGTGIRGTTGTNKGRILINSDGVWGNTGALDFATKAILSPKNINGTYLDINIRCTEPTIKEARVYGTRTVVTVSGDTFTGATLTNGTIVAFRSTGTLPGLIQERVLYQVTGASGNTFKVFPYASSTTAITTTSAGTGTLEVFTGLASGVTSLNIYGVDLTTDSHWSNISGHNVVQTVSGYQSTFNYGISTISAVSATTLTLGIATPVALTPLSFVILVSRNVQIKHDTTAPYAIQDIYNSYIGASVMAYTTAGALISGAQPQRSVAIWRAYSSTIAGVFACFTSVCMIAGPNCSFIGIAAGNSYVIGDGSGTNRYNLVINGSIYGTTLVSASQAAVTLSGFIFCAQTAIYFGSNSLLTNLICEGVENIISTCRNVKVTSSNFYSCKNMITTSYDCLVDSSVNVYGAYCIFYDKVTECTFSGNIFFIFTIFNCPGYNVFDGTFLDAPGCYYTTGLDAKGTIKNCTVPYPLKSSSIGVSHEYYVQRVKFSNVNGTVYNDGYQDLHSIGVRVAQSSGGNVPAAYDTINDFLKVTSYNLYTSKLLRGIIIDRQKVWCNAGSRTVRIRVVNAFSAALSAGNLILQVDYSSAAGTARAIDETSAPSTATDWSQTLEVTFTQAYSDFVYVSLFLCKYEATGNLFVWPWPEVI